MERSQKILTAFILVVIALHIWGAIDASHLNWGVHFFAFYNPFVGVIALAVAALVLIPRVQNRIVGFKESIIGFFDSIPAPFLVGIISACIITLGTLFSAKLHLLGDGILLLRSLSGTEWGPNIMESFNNQPLLYWLFRSALGFGLIDSPATTYDLYIALNRCSAVIMVILLVWMARPLKMSSFSKTALAALVLFGGGFQFFFGYIENYVLQYVLTAAYAITGWKAIEHKCPIAVPVAVYALMCGLHLGNLVFVPSLLVLFLLYAPGRKKQILALVAALGAAGLVFIYLLGYLPALLRHFSPESVDFLHPLSVPTGNFGYAMFSLYHLLDWLNLNMLVAPFGIAVALVLFSLVPMKEHKKHPSLLFLLTAGGCGLLFTWVVNASLGLARDWDLLSGFFVPLMVYDAALFAHTELVTRSRFALVAVVTVVILHCAAWIGVNADEQRHLARMRLLNDPHLLAPTTLLFYDEALANYYFDHGFYAEARTYYEHSLSIDPNNPRIVGNLSDVYRKLGEKDKYFHTLLRAVEMKTTDPGIYSNLGVEYASRGDTDRAIQYNERAIELDPRQDKAHANLGLLYVSRMNFVTARQHFMRAIELGLEDAVLFKYTAEISYLLGDFPNAVRYYDAYLSQNPDDKNARLLRDRAAETGKK